MLDEEWQRAIEIGRRNEEIIDLIRKHCARAVVEKPAFGGRGMLEGSTGLPIDMRTVRCPFAAHPAGAGMQLELIAFEFWRANCRGCPHRQPVGVPNLTTVGEAMLDSERVAQEQAEQERVLREEERRKRSARREGEVAGEPVATRRMIGLLDGVDAEHPDIRGRQLVDEARAAPERCTPAAAKVLLETANTVPDDRLLEAVGHLQRAGRIPSERLLDTARLNLAGRPSRIAAELVVRLRAGLRHDMLASIIPNLVWLAGRSSDPIERGPSYVDGMLVAADANLPVVLDEIRHGIGDAENKWRRMRYAYASAELMKARPEVAELLAPALVDALALPDSLDIHSGAPGLGLRAALNSAFEAQPGQVGALYEKLGPTLSEEAREPVFHAYDSIFRRRLRDADVPQEGAHIAIDAILRHLSGDWGERVAIEAVDALELVSKYHPTVLASRIEAVFGALLDEIAGSEAGEASRLLRPPSPLDTIEAASRDFTRRSRISRLREVAGSLAPLRPEETLTFIDGVLEGSGLPAGEAADDLRGHAVRLLGSIGQMPEYAGRVLPQVVTFALGADVIMRTRTIEALGDISSVRHRRLPTDVAQLLPLWLMDPYRGPHRAAVDAMTRGFPVDEGVLGHVITALVGLARAYTTEDARFLDDVLDQLWALAGRLDPASAETVRAFCLETAQYLSRYDLERFLAWRGTRQITPALLGRFADRLLEVLSDEERITDPNAREDELIRLLRDLPPPVLGSRIDGIKAAALATAPYAAWPALHYVEILERALAWEEALDVAATVLDGIEDTTEHRGVRILASLVVAALRFELAVMRGEVESAESALREWEALCAEREKIERESRSAWQLLLGQ